MARSISDWYADHADGSDGNADDEHVDRQAAWDTSRSDRLLGRPLTGGKSGKGGSRRKPPELLTPKQVTVRPDVLAMHRRNPSKSYKALVELLGAEGIHLTRRDVAAILNEAAGSRPVATPPRRSTGTSSRNATVTKSANVKDHQTRGEKAAQRRRGRRADLQHEPAATEARRAARQIPGRLPYKLSPMSLSLDEPRRRRPKKIWSRAKRGAVKSASRAVSQEAIPPCKACGVIPSPLGVCRCS